jgi:predicted dehydrogenase
VIAPVRVGLVGAGQWARTMHARLHTEGQETQLTGIWSKAPERARALAAEYGVPAFDSFEQLLDASEAVDFAVPPAVQAGLAVQAAEAGKALMLEKPLGATLDQARLVARAIATAGVPSIVVLTKRFHPRTRAFIADALALGARSPAIAVTGRYLHGGFLDTGFLEQSERTGWRQELGVLFDLGPHLLDLVDAASGPIVSITATGDPAEAVMLSTKHASGASGQFVISGRVQLSGVLTDIDLYSHAGHVHYSTSGMDNEQTWSRLRSEFAAAVRDGSPVTVDAERALIVQQLVEAASLSLREQRAVAPAELLVGAQRS